jgi:hypothetical protein
MCFEVEGMNVDIYLHPRLTGADQAIILKYLLNPRALSKDGPNI